MPIVADAAAAIRADMTPFNRDVAAGFNKAETKAKGLGGSLASALNPKSLLLGFGGGLLGSQVISFMADATNAAAEFQDSVSATGVIFGEEFIPQMEEWGDAAAQNFGASKQQAIAAANVFATLGKSAGLMGEELVDFSQEMVQLGGDLASFFGGSTEEAINAVGAALRGESEPIRRYGVLLDDATLRARAFEMGLISTTKNALTPQQRVLAAHAEILEQTSDAQGDFVRTSDGMANTQRELAAEFQNVQIEIGEKLLPIMLDLANVAKDVLLPALEGLFATADESDNWLAEVSGFLDGLSDLGWKSRRAIDAALAEAFDDDELQAQSSAAASSVTNAWDAETAKTYAAAYGVGGAAARGLEASGPEVSDAADDAIAAEVAEAAQKAHEEAVDEISGMFDDLIDLFEGRDDFRDAVEAFHEMVNNPWPDTRRRAAIEAVLASKEVRDGLRSEDSRVRTGTINFVNELVAEYETLAPGALAAGELVNPNLQDGLKRNLSMTLQVAEGIAIATGNELDFREWAENAGLSGLLSFNKGMNSQKGAAAATARSIAGATRAEMYFDAYAGGRASANTFIDGLAGTLTSWDAAARLQNALQLLKLRSLGGSLPTDGPFSAAQLKSGPRSIARYWLDLLSGEISNGVLGLRVPATGVNAPLAPGGSLVASERDGGIRDVHLHLEDKLPPVTRPDDVGGSLRRAIELGLVE